VAEFVDDGVITLARVRRVNDHAAELLVHPEYAVTIEDADAELTALLRPDEVVTVEIVPVDGAFLASFSSDDPAPSMSVVPGGPPWLIREVQAPDDAIVESNAQDEEEPTSPERWLYEEIERLEQQLRGLKEENRQLRRTERERNRIAIPKVYADPVEQLRLELHLAYLSRVSESDRGRYPWPQSYSISSVFVESMDELVRGGGIAREKIVEVCASKCCAAWRSRTGPARSKSGWSLAMAAHWFETMVQPRGECACNTSPTLRGGCDTGGCRQERSNLIG
jgi:hypothetical protein